MKQMLNKNLYFLILFFLVISCVNNSKETNVKEEYFDNGNIKVHVILDGVVEHGLYNKFHENGTLAESGIKIKGKANGVWKYFNSEGYLISVKQYYNDKFLYDLELTDFDFDVKRINENIEIKIPKKWELINPVEESPVILAARKKCDEAFCPNITVTKELSIKKKQIKNYLDKSEEALKEKFNNYRLLKEREYKFENTIYYEKIHTVNYQGINVGGITTWVFNENNTYVVTGFALNEKGNSFLKYEGLLKEITNSLIIK